MKKIRNIILFIIIGLCTLNLASCSPKELFCKHEFKEIVKEATCTEDGYIKEVCSKCGKEKVTILFAKGHTYTEWEIIREATCKNHGLKRRKCTVCGEVFEEKITDKVHDYEYVTIPPTCTEEGYKKGTCKICGETTKIDIVPPLGHSFTEWEVVKPATATEDGIEKRHCTVCNFTEERHYKLNDYLDNSVISFGQDFSKRYEVNSMKELQIAFDAAILNHSPSLDTTIKFDYTDLDTLLKELVKNISISQGFSVNVSCLGKKHTFNFTYNMGPTIKASDKNAYVQYGSFNYQNPVKVRPDDFDNFKVNKYQNEYNVTTSDQLVYCLEHNYRPIPVKGSAAEKMYNLAKDVLREIINDDMNDFEKIKAIHDWLILNVTYDDALLNLAYSGEKELTKYHGFYLEGVFLDQRAVCEGISKALCVLANIEGIPCVVVSGFPKDNPLGMGHAWNKVYIDNAWYIVDATSDGTVINESYEILSYEYFLVTDKKMEERYIGKDYNKIKCITDIKTYENMNFVYDNKQFDFVIDSITELKDLIAYCNISPLENYTVQFYVTFDYGRSFHDELRQACAKLLINSNSYSTLEDGNIITIIK